MLKIFFCHLFTEWVRSNTEGLLALALCFLRQYHRSWVKDVPSLLEVCRAHPATFTSFNLPIMQLASLKTMWRRCSKETSTRNWREGVNGWGVSKNVSQYSPKCLNSFNSNFCSGLSGLLLDRSTALWVKAAKSHVTG